MIDTNKLKEEIRELKRVAFGDSPDTYNLDSYKGLIKNQIEILERNLNLKENPITPHLKAILKEFGGGWKPDEDQIKHDIYKIAEHLNINLGVDE